MKKTIRIYLLLLLGLNFSVGLTFGTYVLFLKANGLDLFGISMVNFFFMFTIVFLEIPTGALADTFSRKTSFLLCCLFYVVGGLYYYAFRGFWNFVLAEVLLGIGSSFLSGAFDAWLIDSLNYQGFRGDLRKIFGSKQWSIRLIQIPATLLGTYLATFDLSHVWLAKSVGVAVVGILAIFLMKEEYPRPRPAGKLSLFAGAKTIVATAREGIRYGFYHREIFTLITLTSVLMLCCQPLNMFWSPLFEGMLGGIEKMGLIMSAINVAILGGILLGGKILPRCRCREHRCLALGLAITAGGMVLAGMWPTFWPTLVFFLLHEAGRGMIGPLNEAAMHRSVTADKRATVISFGSMANKLGATAGLFLFGVAGNQLGIQTAWLIAGLILAAVIPLTQRLKK